MTETRILYNAECPICSREIRHYARLSDEADLALTFEPLTDGAADWGITPDMAARRLHAKRGDLLLVGVPAFIAVWEEIPRYRWLARLVMLPMIRPIATVVYNWIIAPGLYGLHRWRTRRHDR